MKNNSATLTVHDHVGFIDFDERSMDPERLEALVYQLADIGERIGASEQIYVVVVNADGRPLVWDKGDDALFATLGGGSASGATPSFASLLAAMAQPVLIGLGRETTGLGLEMALAGDMRLAVEGAILAMPQVGQGRIPCDGGTQRLARLVGRGHAISMILTGDRIDAGEALRIGLINQVVPTGDLRSRLTHLATRMAAKGPIALQYAKEAILAGLDTTLSQGLHLEADLYMLLHTTADRSEGIRAFQEKRAARFTGE